jgi:maltooligosyltrehalose trehalohydrolase
LSSYPWERALGARPQADGCAFRVWAPRAARVDVDLPGGPAALMDAGYGIWEGVLDASPGTDYRFVLDERGACLPDPASRWQPEGLLGPSRVYAPGSAIAPVAGTMPTPRELVVYELHIGTFSLAGTFSSAMSYLDELARLGVNAIEIMPVAEFPGERGWGYDGVFISAAQSSYGGPQGLCELVEAAHGLGLAVILDVVYNHVGAEGTAILEGYGPYMTGKYETPWGKAMNYDDALCDPVREWVCQSAEGWIRDFGIDGLRLDAIHAIHDSSAEHIVEAIARRVHAIRDDALVIAESGMNDPRVMRGASRGGWGCDAAWADDFHHCVRTLVTDEREGYYAEFGRVSQLAKAFRRPHVHDGDYSSFRERRFGAPAFDVPVEKFVVFSQDHDQVGNRAYGDRMPAAARPLAAFLTLLSPFTPMLFMGEEYGEQAPFQFFSAHIDPYIADQTRTGRRAEFAAFAAFGSEIPDPESIDTFNASKLTRERDPALAELYTRLIEVRRELPYGDVGEVRYDEEQRWLWIVRGPFTLVASFSPGPLEFEVGAGSELVLATHADATQLADGTLSLPPLSGALLRRASV